MADSNEKQPQMTLKAAMETASQQAKESPDWLKSIYERNEVLDRHRRGDVDDDQRR